MLKPGQTRQEYRLENSLWTRASGKLITHPS
jgi:hypothetical protein